MLYYEKIGTNRIFIKMDYFVVELDMPLQNNPHVYFNLNANYFASKLIKKSYRHYILKEELENIEYNGLTINTIIETALNEIKAS